MPTTIKRISTTALAKHHNISSKQLFEEFASSGWIERKDEKWCLTVSGMKQGATYFESEKYGKYIVWPEDIKLISTNTKLGPFLTATTLGKSFDLSAQKINFILSEIGWAKKGIKGWLATDQGLKQGAIQAEDNKSGIPFIRWPETITKNKTLADTIADVKGLSISSKESKRPQDSDFRDKFKAEHRATDGHFTRSKAEMLIDNWLYMFEVVHAYERKLPIEEEVYSDFYIPTGKVYIEYWGYENNPKYLARKKQKKEIYKKYDFNLIELEDKDVQNLDDVLPRLLLKFGVQTY